MATTRNYDSISLVDAYHEDSVGTTSFACRKYLNRTGELRPGYHHPMPNPEPAEFHHNQVNRVPDNLLLDH